MMQDNVTRVVAKFLSAETEGDVVKKFTPPPQIKPPRRRPGIKNKSNRQGVGVIALQCQSN